MAGSRRVFGCVVWVLHCVSHMINHALYATQEAMAPWCQTAFVLPVRGYATSFSCTVHEDFRASICFSFFGKPYSFSCTRWKGTVAQTKFLTLFFDGYSRAPEMFGRMIIPVEEGGIATFDMNEDQRVAAVVQACKDVIFTLDLILSSYECSVLDYACWYREKHPETDTYSQLITLVCCHCIVHSDFLAPNISYELVVYPKP